MHLFPFLNGFGIVGTLTRGRHTSHTKATTCLESAASSTVWSEPASSVLAVSQGVDDCSPGGLCDCSRIPDTNSEEYFQCVTNPNCEHCWVTHTTTTTPIRALANATGRAVTDYHTMAPGTYTITANGTVLNIVVTQQIATPTSSTRAFVTMTETVVVTVQPGATNDPMTTAGDVGDCRGRCDCAKVKDKESKEFFECLTNLECEQCRSAVNAGALASDTASASTTGSASKSVSKASSSAAPTVTCPDFCDCASIEDKESEEFFQCVTNPVCERCNTGG